MCFLNSKYWRVRKVDVSEIVQCLFIFDWFWINMALKQFTEGADLHKGKSINASQVIFRSNLIKFHLLNTDLGHIMENTSNRL